MGADSKGFYYSAYDAPEKGVFSSQNQFQKVYYHRLGTPQSADKLIYKDAEHPLALLLGMALEGRQMALHLRFGGYVGNRDTL